MALKLTASKSDPPLATLVVANLVRGNICVSVEWDTTNSNFFKLPTMTLSDPATINRYLTRNAPKSGLYGGTVLEQSEIDSWVSFSNIKLNDHENFTAALNYLNDVLGPVTYLVASRLTLADLMIWESLYKSKSWHELLKSGSAPTNVARWYKYINSLDAIMSLISSLPEAVKLSLGGNGEATKPKDEGKFVELPGAEMGKVVVRFPPEASGYLHIGHAKAALLNQYYKDTFNGTLIMRFDDTNPAKEKVDFEKVILEDLEKLKITPDKFTHTSNYFEVMLEFCEKLLHQGHAYVDDTNPELMKQEREQRVESKNRNNTVEQNLEMWKEMKAGTVRGQKCCVRAKIDMNSDNGCMRDPTIYRCKAEAHPRTGTKYKVFPTYDFACPIVDSIEGVTHCLRTMEYRDRDEQFYWFIDILGLRKPHIWEYSRLNMMNTVLSKRKLTWFVEQGLVDGWDDPRFPTVQGILRRGMTVEGLKQFIIAQGSSRSVVLMEWDKIWAFNKKIIDPVAPRYTSLKAGDTVPVLVEGVTEQALTVPKHPKELSVGTKTVWVGPRVLIDREDAETLREGENATFINWGNLLVQKINREKGKIVSVVASPNLENTDYKKTVKLTWLAETSKARFVPCFCVYFDHIISKSVLGKDEDFKQYVNQNTRSEVEMLGDPELLKVKKSEIIQLQRRGFFICDSEYRAPSIHTSREAPIVLFYIPDGKAKEMPTSGAPKESKETAAKTPSKEKLTKVAVPSTSIPTPDASQLLKRIQEQGDRVRKLKSEKADKETVAKEVNVLLKLKADFKAATGVEWKPDITVSAATPAAPTPAQLTASAGLDANDILKKIQEQGDKVRNLKSEKADKETVAKEVNVLLKLKADFKAATGVEWKPDIIVPAATPAAPTPVAGAGQLTASAGLDANEILKKIQEQGDKVRNLKSEKADKETVAKEVKVLLKLKADFKAATGVEWKPDITVSAATPAAPTPAQLTASAGLDANEILKKIQEQGDKVRNLKSEKADKETITKEVNVLLQLKDDFKTVTGVGWKPGVAVPSDAAGSSPVESTMGDPSQLSSDHLHLLIVAQGDKVRSLKSEKAAKDAIDAEVKLLLKLKQNYREATGTDWKAISSAAQGDAGQAKTSTASKAQMTDDTSRCEKNPKGAQKTVRPRKEKVSSAKKEGEKKQSRLGLEATKEDNLPEWYSQVITKGELIEYYDVSGCYIYRPWSFAIWEFIKDFLDREIKKIGVQNCYFPLFVSRTVLEKEKTHIADFAPEVAWVTKSGETDLAEPIAVRPTSETVMYPAYAKWIQSYRDLPVKLNQWNNVVRWEFKQPQPFLRTREFLWQEGHTAHASKAEAEEEVLYILGLYEKVYTDLLAIPVIKGRKTEKEKFAGGDYTTTVEGFISASGRAIQGATSHHLGQNFSKMFEIVYEDPDTAEKKFVYQNSWGLTTRTIGVMIMVHADNQGLVLPPNVASIQVVIVPCGITASMAESDKKSLLVACQELEDELRNSGIRVLGDYRDNYSPGWRFNHWELKGVPIRIEYGPKDLAQQQLVAVRRDSSEKITLPRSSASQDISSLLRTIQSSLYSRAENDLTSHTVVCKNWEEFCRKLDEKNIILSPFCGDELCEEEIKKGSARDAEAEPGAPSMGAKSLCIPFSQPASILPSDKCVNPGCRNPPKYYTLFGRSY